MWAKYVFLTNNLQLRTGCFSYISSFLLFLDGTFLLSFFSFSSSSSCSSFVVPWSSLFLITEYKFLLLSPPPFTRTLSLIFLFWKIFHLLFYNYRPLHFYLSKLHHFITLQMYYYLSDIIFRRLWKVYCEFKRSMPRCTCIYLYFAWYSLYYIFRCSTVIHRSLQKWLTSRENFFRAWIQYSVVSLCIVEWIITAT